MSYAFGKWGFWYLSVIQFLFPFTGMLSYLVIVGDTIPEILSRISALEGTVLASHEFIKFLMVLLVMLPLSLYRNIEKLGKVSAFSILCVCFIVIVVVVRAGTMGPDIPRTSGAYSIAKSGVFQAVGIMAFAFVCHHNIFLIYISLAHRSAKKFGKVAHISVFASWAACALLGLAGYLTFTGNTQGDLLRNYCRDDDLLSATRFLYAITIMLTFPIECFVAREVITILYAKFRSDGKGKKFWFHALVTCWIVGFVLVISLPINNLGTVLEFTGCLTATPLGICMCLFMLLWNNGVFPSIYSSSCCISQNRRWQILFKREVTCSFAAVVWSGSDDYWYCAGNSGNSG
jgi:sodium-coupled neutral amino acid transporter 11